MPPPEHPEAEGDRKAEGDPKAERDRKAEGDRKADSDPEADPHSTAAASPSPTLKYSTMPLPGGPSAEWCGWWSSAPAWLWSMSISWALPVVWPGSVYGLEIGIVGTEGVIDIEDTHRDVIVEQREAGLDPDADVDNRNVDILEIRRHVLAHGAAITVRSGTSSRSHTPGSRQKVPMAPATLYTCW